MHIISLELDVLNTYIHIQHIYVYLNHILNMYSKSLISEGIQGISQHRLSPGTIQWQESTMSTENLIKYRLLGVKGAYSACWKNPKMGDFDLKMIFLLVIFRFHVNFRGVYVTCAVDEQVDAMMEYGYGRWCLLTACRNAATCLALHDGDLSIWKAYCSPSACKIKLHRTFKLNRSVVYCFYSSHLRHLI